MDSVKPKSVSNKTKLARTIRKLIHLQTAAGPISDCGILKLKSQFEAEENLGTRAKSHRRDDDEKAKVRSRAAVEAFVAKLFAGVSSVKAAYAELQLAQSPYDGDAIQSADEAVVKELRVLSELKKSFLKKSLDPCPPHVTLMLAEIQEQQSLMKTYEITVKSLEAQIKRRDSSISSLRTEVEECDAYNMSLEKKLNASGYLYAFDSIRLATLNPNDFIQVLHYALKSIRSFVKLMIREMESANWDLHAAANSIEPNIVYAKPSHRCFAFESFVTREMFDGFNYPNFSLPDESMAENPNQFYHFERFKKLKSTIPTKFLASNPHSAFAAFTRAKYLKLVHPKMECSLFGNLRQRNVIASGECPDSAFFVTFAEMAKRVWMLHSLAYSFDQEATIFQVRRNSRFSEVFMECVNDESSFDPSGDDLVVGFTVMPGFKIGKTAIQCQVYLSPATTPANR